MSEYARKSAEELTEPFRQMISMEHPDGPELICFLDEINRRLGAAEPEADTFVLPIPLQDRIIELFGRGGRTFLAIEKRCKFALKVWDGKYGPLTPEQHQYAVTVLLWALDPAAVNKAQTPRAAAYGRLDKVVNHERTHAGFKQREGLVDVSSELKDLAA